MDIHGERLIARTKCGRLYSEKRQIATADTFTQWTDCRKRLATLWAEKYRGLPSNNSLLQGFINAFFNQRHEMNQECIVLRKQLTDDVV